MRVYLSECNKVMYSFLLTFWTLSFDIFTYNVYHMYVNLILMHIWDAFGFVLKIGCDIMAHICPSSTLLQFWKEASKYIWWFLRISQDSQWERKNLQWWRGSWAINFQICWFFLVLHVFNCCLRNHSSLVLFFFN